jgi:hypothetical protein
MQDGSDPDPATGTANKAVHCTGFVIASLSYGYGKKSIAPKKGKFFNFGFQELSVLSGGLDQIWNRIRAGSVPDRKNTHHVFTVSSHLDIPMNVSVIVEVVQTLQNFFQNCRNRDFIQHSTLE